MRAEDLIAAVFPDQIACAENLVGDREIPDHPLVRQAVHDCLYEAMDIEGLERLLRGIESGRIEVIARDLAAPSPLALEILTARPYAYLDDAPLEERRTQAVMGRRWLDEASASTFGQLDIAAIERVREEAWPEATSADEMHDALLGLAFITPAESARNAEWPGFLAELARQRRATRITVPNPPAGRQCELWVAAERLPQLDAVLRRRPARRRRRAGGIFTAPMDARSGAGRNHALRLEALGPVTSVHPLPLRCASPWPTPTRRSSCWRRKALQWREPSRPRSNAGMVRSLLARTTATRCNAFVRKSSPSARRISCASCSAGST
jgi:ATP-dependent Lhr-like helicase